MSSFRMSQAPRAPFARFRLRPLAASCAAVLLGLALSASASAQQTQPPPQPTDNQAAPAKPDSKTAGKKNKKSEDTVSNLDAVVVTGIRASIENSLRAKQNSDNIIEAISAEDIGKLPDASIAESLSRVPGLATQRLNGRANMISIRGLDPGFAGTTLNGREQATIGENRGVEYDQYPSELISGVAIYKTPDASLIGQACPAPSTCTPSSRWTCPALPLRSMCAASTPPTATSTRAVAWATWAIAPASPTSTSSSTTRWVWPWASPTSTRRSRKSSTRPGGGA